MKFVKGCAIAGAVEGYFDVGGVFVGSPVEYASDCFEGGRAEGEGAGYKNALDVLGGVFVFDCRIVVNVAV